MVALQNAIESDHRDVEPLDKYYDNVNDNDRDKHSDLTMWQLTQARPSAR